MEAWVAMLAALGQAARLSIFRLLVRAGPGGRCVDDIRRQLRIPGSTLSHHLDTLARCRLIAPRRNGRFIYYAVDWNQTADLIRFLTEDCCADLHRQLRPAVAGVAVPPSMPAPTPGDGGRRRASHSRRRGVNRR